PIRFDIKYPVNAGCATGTRNRWRKPENCLRQRFSRDPDLRGSRSFSQIPTVTVNKNILFRASTYGLESDHLARPARSERVGFFGHSRPGISAASVSFSMLADG